MISVCLEQCCSRLLQAECHVAAQQQAICMVHDVSFFRCQVAHKAVSLHDQIASTSSEPHQNPMPLAHSQAPASQGAQALMCETCSPLASCLAGSTSHVDILFPGLNKQICLRCLQAGRANVPRIKVTLARQVFNRLITMYNRGELHRDDLDDDALDYLSKQHTEHQVVAASYCVCQL